jgi:uncharacterized protein YbjT (DUF2867 family)
VVICFRVVITISGSTGTIGIELVRLLSKAAAPTRALFRDSRKVEPLPGVAWTQADLSDARVLEPAIAGTTRLFLLTDNQPGFAKLQIQILEAAQFHGVAHVVKLSALGASDHSKSWIGREHHEVEEALEKSSMQRTILRPHAFMQNWLGDLAQSVRSRGVIESPVGNGRVPFIDTRDIAAVAAEILLHPEMHMGKKYVLTGGEAVGFNDIAQILNVTYKPLTMDEARAQLESKGVPREQIDAMLALSAYQKAGGPTAIVSDSVARILGRPPRTIREFFRDHADAFRGNK